MDKNTIRFLITACLTTVMVFLFSVPAFAALPGETLTVTCSEGLNLRSAPYGDILTGIPCGCSVCVVSDDGSGWILVNYDGCTGYVCADYVSSYYDPSQYGSYDSSGYTSPEYNSSDYISGNSADNGASYSYYDDSTTYSDSSVPGYYDDYGNWTAYDVTSYAGGYYDQYGCWVDWTSGSDSGADLQNTDICDSQVRGSGQEVADLAMQYVGLPYVWGSESLTSGADCSGFTRAIYEQFGIDLYHYDLSQQEQGYSVASLDEALPGDLVFYQGHVAIYIGDGKIVHAANPEDGTIISNADYSPIVCIRRFF